MPKKIDYSSLYTLRKDGRYQASYTDDTGHRHFKYGRDPEKLYEMMQTVQEPQEPTFADLLWRWKAEHVDSLERGTQATYKAPIEHASKCFGNTLISQITANDINAELLREKQLGYSYKHAAALKSIYKQVFDYAIVNGYISVNPTAAVKVPRGMARMRREAPEDEQIQIIVNSLNKPFGVFAALLLYTGMRTEEAVVLQWEDIDFKNKTIYVRKAVDLHGMPKIKCAKTVAGEREIPILPQLKKYLVKPKGAKNTDYVFSDDGKLLTRGRINTLWISWCKSAGLAYQKTYDNRHRGKRECTRTEWRPTVTPHQFRHNYATVLYEAGIDELAAKDLMGHADIATTKAIYTSLRKRHKDEQIEKLKSAFDVSNDVKCHNKPINTANG